MSDVSVSPLPLERDSNGLIKGINYIFKDDTRKVDWFAMIPKQYFVPNKIKFEKRGEPIPNSIENLDNQDILLLLDAFKFLVDLRGYNSITLPLIQANGNRTTTTCQIEWIPNFETGFEKKITTACGDATMESTNGFGFIGPISENRAFIRCVRNFLKIPVLGKDELDQNSKVKAAPSKENTEDEEDNSLKTKRVKSLQVLMKEKGVSFESLVKKAVEENNMENGAITNLNDFSLSTINDFITRLNKLK